jgi:nitrile hydratase
MPPGALVAPRPGGHDLLAASMTGGAELDGIHDMGGMQDWGSVSATAPDDPPFTEDWEKRAFALALLSMRVSGTNLDAFRHSMNRLQPLDYLADGYYGRWLRGAENLLTDSGIIAPGAVDARTRKQLGEDVIDPPEPEPSKPDYKPTGGGSLRPLDAPPRFSPGDSVRAKDIHPSGHTRLPHYVRGRAGTVRRRQPAAVFPDTNAHFQGENIQHVYSVEFHSQDLWGDDAEVFVLNIDLYDDYLEPVS